MRAVSRSYRDGQGRQVVDIVTEEDYYRWMFDIGIPTPTVYPVRLVWVQ